MDNREHREHEFNERLTEKVAANIGDISDVLSQSRVGKCGGKCQGFGEADLKDLCQECLQALDTSADEIFSASSELQRLGDVMNRQG